MWVDTEALEVIPEEKFRLLRVYPRRVEVIGDFAEEEAFRKADEFNRKRRLPTHPYYWVYNSQWEKVRTEEAVGEPMLGFS